MNLTVRLFGRELLAVSAWFDKADTDEVTHSIGFAAGEIA